MGVVAEVKEGRIVHGRVLGEGGDDNVNDRVYHRDP